MPKRLIIAIDGPSGAGKGTIARTLAERLHYRHVDTGAMYRAVAWKALDDRVALDDEPAVAALAQRSNIDLESGRVMIDGRDVTKEIRTAEIDKAASSVARMPRVRQVLVERQRRMAEGRGVGMGGRDIGTVVFPNADVKIYLDASPDERARRRMNDPAHSGGPAAANDVAGVASALNARDESDRTRTVSPLYAATDAVVVDTTGQTVDQVVDQVLAVVYSFSQR